MTFLREMEKYNMTITEIQSKFVIYVLHIDSMSHFYYYLFDTIVLIILYSCIYSHEHVACKSLSLTWLMVLLRHL